MDLTKIFTTGTEQKMKLKKSTISDEWMVQKGDQILYVGSKDLCKKYISHH